MDKPVALIGATIGRLRKDRGITQEALAEVLGLASKAQMSRLESGERNLMASDVMKLAQFFEVPVDSLLYPELFSESYRGAVGDPEGSEDMQWFRDFRRRYRLFTTLR